MQLNISYHITSYHITNKTFYEIRPVVLALVLADSRMESYDKPNSFFAKSPIIAAMVLLKVKLKTFYKTQTFHPTMLCRLRYHFGTWELYQFY